MSSASMSFFDVLLVDLDHQRRLGLRAFAHRLAFQHHAFGLNGFHEIHEGVGADHADVFLDAAGIHLAQAAPQRLLGQDVALGGIGAQAHNGRDVAHVPALFEHHHRDDGLVGAVQAVDLVGLLAQFIQLFLALARRRFGNLAVVLGVNDQHGVFQGPG